MEGKKKKNMGKCVGAAVILLLSVSVLAGMAIGTKEKAPDALKVDVVCSVDYWNTLDLSDMSFSSEEEAEALAERYLKEIDELLELDGWWKGINPDADTLLLNWQMGDVPESSTNGIAVSMGADTVEGNVIISIKGGMDGGLAHELAHVIGFVGNFSYALSDGICEYVQTEVGENLNHFNKEWDWQEVCAVMFRHEYTYSEEARKHMEEICGYVGAVHVGYPYGQGVSLNYWYQLNQSFVRYLIGQYGLEAVKGITLEGVDESSYEEYFGKPLEELRRDWMDYLMGMETDVTVEDIVRYSVGVMEG